jgi:uncharacterized protein YndB with AHSA1/START domain
LSRRRLEASPEEVWTAVSDHGSYRHWTILTSSRLEEEGHPHRDGVGALRFLGVGGAGARERVVAFDPPHRLTYRLERGAPVRGYQAEVQLTPAEGGGTEIVWSGSFDSAPPGTAWFFQRMFRGVVTHFVDRLARLGR